MKKSKLSRIEPAAGPVGTQAAPAGTSTAASEPDAPLPPSQPIGSPSSVLTEGDQKPVDESLDPVARAMADDQIIKPTAKKPFMKPLPAKTPYKFWWQRDAEKAKSV